MIGSGLTLSDVSCWRRNEKFKSLSGKSVAQRPSRHSRHSRRRDHRDRRNRRRRHDESIFNSHKCKDIFLETLVHLPVRNAGAILGDDVPGAFAAAAAGPNGWPRDTPAAIASRHARAKQNQASVVSWRGFREGFVDGE